MKLEDTKIGAIAEAARKISYMMGSEWTAADNGSIRGSQEYGFRGKEYKRVFQYVVPYGDSPTQVKGWETDLGNYLETVDPQTVLDLVSDLSMSRHNEQKAVKEAEHWKANHECEVSRARVLKERLDMPLERVNAYNRMVELEEENKALKQRIASLEDVEQTRMMMQMIHSMVIDTQQMSREQLRYWQTHFRNPNGW